MDFSYYNCLVPTLILTCQYRWFFLKKKIIHINLVRPFTTIFTQNYSEGNISDLKSHFLNKKILRQLKRKKK